VVSTNKIFERGDGRRGGGGREGGKALCTLRSAQKVVGVKGLRKKATGLGKNKEPREEKLEEGGRESVKENITDENRWLWQFGGTLPSKTPGENRVR